MKKIEVILSLIETQMILWKIFAFIIFIRKMKMNEELITKKLEKMRELNVKFNNELEQTSLLGAMTNSALKMKL